MQPMYLQYIKQLHPTLPFWLARFFDLVMRAEVFGSCAFPNGAFAVGQVPRFMPGAESWFHTLYPGIEPGEFDHLEVDLGLRVSNPDVLIKGVRGVCDVDTDVFPMPEIYLMFLRVTNGARLFSAHLNLFGVRRALGGDPLVNRQPYELAGPNIFRRPKRLPRNSLVVGCYKWDGSLIYFDGEANEVIRCHRDDGRPLNKWQSFEAMLVSECERLSMFFDDRGVLLNESIPTTP